MSMVVTGLSLRSPKQVSELLQRMGPVTTKIGQYLALRRDLLPREYCEELLRLTDRVPSFSWSEARIILTEELGREPEQIFECIDRAPFASGSLSQVHRARLDDGTELAVKVQRPRIAEQVERDLERLRRLGKVVERTGWNLSISPTELVAEIGNWLRREIDLTREFESARRLWRHTADSRIQRIPEVFAGLSTKRVITYEYLEGAPVSSILRGVRRLGAEDRRRFAENLVEALLTQLFRYQFFHADLHPGNLLVLPGNIVGFVDFGFCDALDDSVRTNQMRYLTAVYNDDVAGMFRALTDILIANRDADPQGFRRDFVNDRRALEGRRKNGSEEEEDDERRQPAGDYLSTVLNAARRNGYRVPVSILSIYRALLSVELVASQLGLGDAIREVGSGFFRDIQRREFLASLTDEDRKQQFFVSLLNFVRDTPRQLNQILTDISDGTLSVRVEVADDPRVTKQRNRRAKLSAISILSVSVAVLLTHPGLPVFMGMPLAWVLILVLVGMYGMAFSYWRRL